MPDDCGLNPPIETLPQMAHWRAMEGPQEAGKQSAGPEGPQRGGMIARTFATAEAGRRPTRRSREEDVVRVPSDPIPGRSLISRRAIADIVRAATLGSYGVTGFAGDPVERLAALLGLAQPGIRLDLRDGRLRIELDLTVAYGLPIAEVARQVDSAVRYAVRRGLGRDVDDLAIHVDGLRFQPGSGPPVAHADPAAIRPADLADSGTDVA
jgi:uncharacterized alkaline shock family protein YloU